MKKLYVDVNIYLDKYFNRADSKLPLGEFAYLLFKRAIECEFTIVYSEVVVEELCKVLSISEEECFSKFFSELKLASKLEEIELEQNDNIEIQKIIRETYLSFKDAIHYFLSIKSDSILVSRNYHLLNLDEKCALKPEEL